MTGCGARGNFKGSPMDKLIFISDKARAALERQGVAIDADRATRPSAGDTKLLTAQEKLDIFLRVHGRIFPSQETELAFLRMTNAANRERYGQ